VFDDTESLQSMMQQQLSLSSSAPYIIQNVVTRLTILFYLNDNFSAGETNFYPPIHDRSPSSLSLLSNDDSAINDDDDDDDVPPPIIASVRPKTGMCLIFPQCVGADVMERYAQYYWPPHEGSPVRPKNTSSASTSSSTTSSPKYVIRNLT
jgi:hypothetical protein